MKKGFLYIPSEETFINMDHITTIVYTDGGDDVDDNNLTISTDDDGEAVDVYGKEAEELYLELIKKLPDLITINVEK